MTNRPDRSRAGQGDSETLTTERHLGALRRVVRQPRPTAETWRESLHHLAASAQEALEGDLGLVAVWDADASRWTAYTAADDVLQGDEISFVASRTVLDAVRDRGRAIATSTRLDRVLRSSSARLHEIHSVVAVPLRSTDPTDESRPRRFLGCLYVDRRGEERAFLESETELAIDLARLTEGTLDLVKRADAAEHQARILAEQVHAVRRTAHEEWLDSTIDSNDAPFREQILQPLRRAAETGGIGLLLYGPTGSGKTHLAQTFHYLSSRRSGPFVVLDCGQVPSAEALAAELFGYAARSGFSAPKEGRPGKAQLADGGTLLIDEVNSLPMELQARLLRVIDTGRLTPLGASEEESVDLQVVAAASENPRDLFAAGRFRQDLYFRLAEMTLELPALDERPADIAPLSEKFLAAARERFDRPAIELSAAAFAALERFPWSRVGNLRGLQHTVNRSVLLAPPEKEILEPEDLLFPEGGRHRPDARDEEASSRDEALEALLADKIEQYGGVVAHIAADAEVAAALGSRDSAPPSTVRMLIGRLGLRPELDRAREGAQLQLAEVADAIRRHGTGAAAARALGVSRDQVAWVLRKAGLTVREVREGEAGSAS